MIPFSLGETISSLLFAAQFGAACCLSYNFLCLFSRILSIMFYKREYLIYKRGHNIKALSEHIVQGVNEKESTPGFLFQFIFTLFFGVIYIILRYICCDGIFRIYFPSTALICFFLTLRIYKRFLYTPMLSAMSFVFSVVILALSLFLTPIRFVFIKALNIITILLKIPTGIRIKKRRCITAFDKKGIHTDDIIRKKARGKIEKL